MDCRAVERESGLVVGNNRRRDRLQGGILIIPDDLPEQHRRHLLWFAENEGRILGWQAIVSSDLRVANIPKGIYKPSWTKYALSAKQTLRSPYADREPTYQGSGWSYLYYQEEQEGKNPESLPSNRAMAECIADGIPIGVLRQKTGKPNVTYQVLGLANVLGKAAGYYLLEGFGQPLETVRRPALSYLAPDGDSTVAEIASDLRLFRTRSVVQRQGQPRFREQLMQLYDRQCAVSRCDVTDVLEAAHILPYRGPHTNDLSNGIILRADFHILFDEGLLAIDDSSLSIRLSPSIVTNKYYSEFHGIELHPSAEKIDPELLRAHRHYCGF